MTNYEKNKEIRKQYAKDRYHSNEERRLNRLEQMRQYRKAHAKEMYEKNKEKNKLWSIKNQDHLREYRRKWREKQIAHINGE